MNAMRKVEVTEILHNRITELRKELEQTPLAKVTVRLILEEKIKEISMLLNKVVML
jgi:hypothetical protein